MHKVDLRLSEAVSAFSRSPPDRAARRGPEGRRPDLLREDFGLPQLMGPAGLAAWDEYLALRRRLRTAPEADKPALLDRALRIAQAHGFEPPR